MKNNITKLVQASFSEVELRALAYDGSFNHDPLMPHQHTCGVTVTGRILDYGCGHSWTHTGTPEPTNKVRAQEHMCPKCGKGPWYSLTGEKK